MKLNGERLRKPDELQKGKLYAVRETGCMQVREEQEDGSVDLVEVEMRLRDGEYGRFGKEYRPIPARYHSDAASGGELSRKDDHAVGRTGALRSRSPKMT